MCSVAVRCSRVVREFSALEDKFSHSRANKTSRAKLLAPTFVLYVVLQCIAVVLHVRRSAIQYCAVCCSALQCVAVRCSVLQCFVCSVAVHCSSAVYVSQCVAVCCSVLQCESVAVLCM